MNDISGHLPPTSRGDVWWVRQQGLVPCSQRQPGRLREAGSSLFPGIVLWFLDCAWAAPAVVPGVPRLVTQQLGGQRAAQTHPALQLLALLGVLHLGAVGHTGELHLVYPLPVVFLCPKKREPIALGLSCAPPSPAPTTTTYAHIHTYTFCGPSISLWGGGMSQPVLQLTQDHTHLRLPALLRLF